MTSSRNSAGAYRCRSAARWAGRSARPRRQSPPKRVRGSRRWPARGPWHRRPTASATRSPASPERGRASTLPRVSRSHPVRADGGDRPSPNHGASGPARLTNERSWRTSMASTATTQTDEDIQREVLRELKWDAEVAPNEIGVAVKNGVATLTGWVDTFSKKWAAERAALRIRGVKAVVNNIEVRLAPSHEQSDTDLAQSVARALEMDALVPEDRVKVS